MKMNYHDRSFRDRRRFTAANHSVFHQSLDLLLRHTLAPNYNRVGLHLWGQHLRRHHFLRLDVCSRGGVRGDNRLGDEIWWGRGERVAVEAFVDDRGRFCGRV